ncbi:unnamed protein product [Bursaphelenchus okinawaensis]|uniref:RRM domain-containing protein n=1 Tax=Bursaphelenchus okinawaensis TaxID=465554 RepID=A0A811K570_9BILA|nr:unnamed protein product [Bursaphelenchus okinawaensis]CAG9090943.1 unnamed protein product [Bursaphelenchus okinawaensis]
MWPRVGAKRSACPFVFCFVVGCSDRFQSVYHCSMNVPYHAEAGLVPPSKASTSLHLTPFKTVAATFLAANSTAATAAVQLAAVTQPTAATITLSAAGLKRAHSPNDHLAGAPIVDQSTQIALAAAAAAATNSGVTNPALQPPFQAFQPFQTQQQVVQQLLQSQQNNLAYYESLNAKRLRLAAPVASSFAPTNLLMTASAPLRPLIQNNVSMTPCDQQQMSNLLVLGGAATPTGQNSNALGSTSRGSATPGSASASQLDISTSTQQQPNYVLRVIVDNMICPVTLDILYSIFSRYGKVLRIITFSKNHTFQALIQFSEANAAQTAKSALDGQNIFNNCCNLRIDYSKLATLNVKYNNDKSRDYTNPLLPPGELSLEQQLSLAQNSLVVPSLLPFATNPANPVASIYNQQNVLASGLGTNIAALMAASNGANGIASPSLNVTAQTLLQQQLGSLLNTTPVVLVSNLDHKKVTPDALFTLFGVYGDVQRVKILFNKKDNALVQYAECQQAQLAIQHLDKAKWHDKIIRVASSKHTNVQMPKEGQPDVGLTRDYTNSPLHRFKKPGSKNYMNIYPPSSTLHLSNIPPNITLEFLKGAFEENGFVVKDFQFFQRDHKMALVQLDDVESAIQALVVMHNFKLADNAHLRVSFSKKGLRV